MHGFAKRGLALAAAASGLVMGIGSAAYADATSSGDTAFDHGVGAGSAIGGAAEAPILLCGTDGSVVGFHNHIPSASCDAAHTVQVDGNTSYSGGVVAGNVIQAGAAVPGELCGNNVFVGGIKERIDGSTCTIGEDGPIATATGSAVHSGGVVSGNVINLAAAVPLELCGNNVGVVAVKDHIHGTTCNIS